jgi:hypothetical protein
MKKQNHYANWKKTDSQSTRRKAVLSYAKGDCAQAARVVKRIQYSSEDASIKRKACGDAEYFKARAQRQRSNKR